jgi:hypothetical protein
VWYPGTLPAASEPLLGCAETVLVDSKEAGGERAFAILRELAARRPIVDLTWERLRPWRELLAALFDSPFDRPFAYGVSSIDVDGKPGPRHLLAGWLSSRLRTPRAAVHLRDAQHVSVRLLATHEGRTGHFSVVRARDERTVRATATVEDGPQDSEVLPLPDDSLAWSVGRALTHLGRDPVWEEALGAAVGLAG